MICARAGETPGPVGGGGPEGPEECAQRAIRGLGDQCQAAAIGTADSGRGFGSMWRRISQRSGPEHGPGQMRRPAKVRAWHGEGTSDRDQQTRRKQSSIEK